MANKYRQHSRARLTHNLRDNMKHLDDILEDETKERAERITRTFAVARQMFDVLCQSGLAEDGRQTALQFLNTLHNRFGVSK